MTTKAQNNTVKAGTSNEKVRKALRTLLLAANSYKPLSARRIGRLERGETAMTCGELMGISRVLGVHPYSIFCEREVPLERIELLDGFLQLLEKGDHPCLSQIEDIVNTARSIRPGELRGLTQEECLSFLESVRSEPDTVKRIMKLVHFIVDRGSQEDKDRAEAILRKACGEKYQAG